MEMILNPMMSMKIKYTISIHPDQLLQSNETLKLKGEGIILVDQETRSMAEDSHIMEVNVTKEWVTTTPEVTEITTKEIGVMIAHHGIIEKIIYF
jgi:hypothetical protein